VIFTVEQVRAIRDGKATAALVPTSERIRTGSLRLLRRCEVTARMRRRPALVGPPREVLAYIEARLDLDPTVETISDTMPNGDRIAVVLTVLAIRDLEVVTLGFPEARACGLALRAPPGRACAVRSVRARRPARRSEVHLRRLARLHLRSVSRDVR
jgi:hypothetical protein